MSKVAAIKGSQLEREARILVATSWIELRKRFAGTFIGAFWLILYPALFLGMYMFLYMVVFKVRYPDLGEFSYVVFIFCALVPYLALMETASVATVVIRQNIHLIKNVMLPARLIPARVALTAMIAQIPGLVIVIALSAADGNLSWKLAFLPVILIIQFAFLLGLSFYLSAFGGLLPDLQTGINIILIFLLFVSPIAFPPDLVPAGAKLVLQLNPVTYLINIFRGVLLARQSLDVGSVGAAAAISGVLLFTGYRFFGRYKAYIVDHE
ncbi:MAG: ABC transporter permease [Parvularculaceae bacterium]